MNRLTLAVLVIVVVSTVLATGAVVYFRFNLRFNQGDQPPSFTANPPQPRRFLPANCGENFPDRSSWQTFTNQRRRYSVQYPPDWEVREEYVDGSEPNSFRSEKTFFGKTGSATIWAYGEDYPGAREQFKSAEQTGQQITCNGIPWVGSFSAGGSAGGDALVGPIVGLYTEQDNTIYLLYFQDVSSLTGDRAGVFDSFRLTQ